MPGLFPVPTTGSVFQRARSNTSYPQLINIITHSHNRMTHINRDLVRVALKLYRYMEEPPLHADTSQQGRGSVVHTFEMVL
jgi:hypothetical protein